MDESLRRDGDMASAQFDELQSIKGGNTTARYGAIIESVLDDDFEGPASNDEI